ncbi:unnamed protein product [Vitrella brassicaformis CCMP3155]|uniref:Methyltransferase FkbM domain-containing protein n=2 Tax=Vitrella brassicaformis TaxID=1169539 RepID=A0A0G4EEW7_VITBC|nr:unnamed protein product [Vitrella brassicaformis CCMP3155]|eukprot:CEL94561.1 unnamed protein product [Vitrella brassicaformis CCMP3155]
MLLISLLFLSLFYAGAESSAVNSTTAGQCSTDGALECSLADGHLHHRIGQQLDPQRLFNESTHDENQNGFAFKHDAASYLLTRGKHGSFVVFPLDFFVSASLIVHGVWEETLLMSVEKLLQPGCWVADVGANIGSLTVPMARRVAPHGRVVAFEPFRRIFQVLAANVVLNGLGSVVRTVNAAVGNAKELMTIPTYDYDHIGNFGASTVDTDRPSDWIGTAGKATEAVWRVRLDDMEWPRLDVIKIDVERMGMQVLQGAMQTTARHLPVLMVEADLSSPQTVPAFLDSAAGKGTYSCFFGCTRPQVGVLRNEDFTFIPPDCSILTCVPPHVKVTG